MNIDKFFLLLHIKLRILKSLCGRCDGGIQGEVENEARARDGAEVYSPVDSYLRCILRPAELCLV